MATADRVFRVDRLGDLAGVYEASECLHHHGGAAANAAIAVARLGGRSSFAGCVGSDDVGDRVLLRLAAAGVAVDDVQRVDRPTPVRTVVHDSAGKRVIFAHTVRDYFAGADPARAETLRDADAVLVDGMWIAGSLRTLAAAREAGVPGVVDVIQPLGDELEDVIQTATHLVFTRQAIMAAAHTSDAHIGLGRISRRTAAWVGVTKGAQGASWIHEHGLQHHASYDVGTNDTFAAGDVFRGAFALALAEAQSADDAVHFATAAAAAKCLHNGGAVDMPDRDEVEALLSAQPRDLLPWRVS